LLFHIDAIQHAITCTGQNDLKKGILYTALYDPSIHVASNFSVQSTCYCYFLFLHADKIVGFELERTRKLWSQKSINVSVENRWASFTELWHHRMSGFVQCYPTFWNTCEF